MELYEYSAHELSKMLSEKKVSSEELTKSVLDRAAATDEKVGAYLTICGEEALKKAREVDEKRAKETLHPLAGIPIGIKDNISTKGLLTTCASKMLYNYVPPFDAFVMKKVNAADMVVTGKLNMDEFAMGSSTENSYFKKTHNPHNLDCVPGGSAAAVAAGSAVISLGSDTGGSIRMPAAYCGVVGLKPTYGSVSRYGLVAFASSLDQIGPFGRNVTDTAMLYSVICGHDNMDATSADREYPDFTALLNSDVKGLKIGIPEEYYGEGVDNSVKETVMNAVKELEKQGAEIVNISLPSTKYALNAYYIISSAEASSNLARFDGVKYGYRTENYASLIDMYEKTRSEGFGDEVKRRIMLGTFVLSSGFFDAYYKKAKLVALDIVKEFNAAFEKCDVIATPATPATAFKLGDCKMQEGSIRCDVNVSVRPKGSTEFGNRVEMKNVNSFSGAMRAIDYEANRQIEVLERGEEIYQETRRWDDQKGMNILLRSKEDAQDYRYFPEPDLTTIYMPIERVEELKNSLPELPNAKIKRYVKELGLSQVDAELIAENLPRCRLFDECIRLGGCTAKNVSNRVLADVSKYMNETGKDIADSNLTAEKLVKIITLIESGKISNNSGKIIFEEIIRNGADIDKVIEEKGLVQISDDSAIEKLVNEVMAANQKSVDDYRGGKTNALGFLVGQCMKASKGQANPAKCKEPVLKYLNG